MIVKSPAADSDFERTIGMPTHHAAPSAQSFVLCDENVR